MSNLRFEDGKRFIDVIDVIDNEKVGVIYKGNGGESVEPIFVPHLDDFMLDELKQIVQKMEELSGERKHNRY